MSHLQEALEKKPETDDDVIFVAKDMNRFGAKAYGWTLVDKLEYSEYEVILPEEPCHFYARVEIKEFDHFSNQEYLVRILELICNMWNSTFREKIHMRMFKVFTDDVEIFQLILPHFAMDQKVIYYFMREVEMACYRLAGRPRLVQQSKSTVFDMSIYNRYACVPMCQSVRKKRRMRVLEEGDSIDYRQYLVRASKDLPTPSRSGIGGVVPEEVEANHENWDMDESNADEILRSVPIFLFDKDMLLDFLVHAKRAAISEVNMEHLLTFRFGRRIRCPWMVFYRALTVEACQHSLRGLLSFLNQHGIIVSHLAQTPELFEGARQYQHVHGVPIEDYELPTGRAKPIEVKNTDLFPNQSFLSVSPMGSGKTFQQLQLVQDMLRADPETAVIILSCRQLMAKDIERRYKEAVPDIQNYLTIKNDNKYSQAVRKINMAKRLIIQLESLHLIDCTKDMLNHHRRKLLLIVDEAETVFAQFVSRTMDRHYRTTWNTFRSLVDHSTVVLFGEAVPSVRTYLLCRELCPNLSIERNVAPRVAGIPQRTAIHYDCYASLVMGMEERLRKQKRCGVFCSSVELGQKLFDLFKTRFRCQFYSSKDRTAHHEFDDLHQHWDKYDMTIWTSVVTVGVSYDLAHFDFMAAFISCGGPYIRDCIQAVHRIRNLTDNELLWASKGPFCKTKKEEEPPEDNVSEVASEEANEEDEEKLVFFESGNVMCKLLDERNSKLDKDFADKVDASDPMIRKLVFYEYYEKNLQRSNVLAGLLFRYFLQWYLNYKMESGTASLNEDSGNDKMAFAFDQLRFRHAEIEDEEKCGTVLHRELFTPNWQNLLTVVLTQTEGQGDEKVTRVLFEQSLKDSSEDHLSDHRETLVYRQEIKQIHRMLCWCAEKPYLDLENSKFMTAVWQDFRAEQRSWTYFPKILQEDADHDTALHNALIEQKMRTQNERSLVSDASLNYLKARWELQLICGVSSSYDVGPPLTESALTSQASRIHAVYEMIFGAYRKNRYQSQNLRLMMGRMIRDLNIGVAFHVEKPKRDGKREYTCQWMPHEMVLAGVQMLLSGGQAVKALKPVRDQTLPITLKRNELVAGIAKKKRGRPRKDKKLPFKEEELSPKH